jgi:hypothetical protein
MRYEGKHGWKHRRWHWRLVGISALGDIVSVKIKYNKLGFLANVREFLYAMFVK